MTPRARLTPRLLRALAALTPEISVDEAASRVQWEDYHPSVRLRIDEFAILGDWSALQREFDIAERNHSLTMQRVGHNNAALMGYIHAVMREGGAYRT